MKVAFVGNFDVPYSSESDYLWTMRERLGFEVVTVQENRCSGEEIEAAAKNSDVLFWVHTHGWAPTGKPTAVVLAELKRAGIPTFSYHLDLWMGLDRQTDLWSDPFWQVEHFFTVDKLMADYLNQHDELPHGHFVRAGVVERDCYLADVPLSRDVIFVGSKGYHHEWPYRPKLIDWLTETYGPRFEHWGGDGRGVVRGVELNNLLASSRIAIADTLCIGFNYPYYTSERVYDHIGRGGFVIHPYIRGMEEEFEDLSTIVFYQYGDFDQLQATIDHYLKSPAERETIRKNGQQYVKEHCTYTHRLRQIFEVLGA